MSARERLIVAAVQIFEKEGYSGATTAAIASQAGLAEVTLFRHFGNKQNLFAEALKQIRSNVDLESIGDSRGDDYREAIRGAARQLCQYFIEENRTIRMMLFESTRSQQLREALHAGPLKNLGHLAGLFSRLIAEGEVAQGDPRVYADALLSLVFGYAIGLVSLSERPGMDACLERLDRMITGVFLPGIAKERITRDESE
jgi:AcrR family transcriptional regulator